MGGLAGPPPVRLPTQAIRQGAIIRSAEAASLREHRTSARRGSTGCLLHWDTGNEGVGRQGVSCG